MSNKEKERRVTLADLGVNTHTAKEETKSGIITPNAVGGIKDGSETQIGDIAAFVPKVEPQKQFEANEGKIIDEGISRVKADLVKNVIDPLKDKVIAARIEAEAENPTRGEEMLLEVPLNVAQVESIESKILDSVNLDVLTDINRFSIDDNDLKELMDDDDEVIDAVNDEPVEEESEEKKKADEEEKKRQEEIFKGYQAQIRDKIKVTKNVLNLNEFRISTKPVSITKALRHSTKQLNTAQWVLPNSKRLITFSALGGEEITNLNPENFKNRMHAFRTAYSIMFNHLVDANKPENMDSWLKTICGFDIENMYFCLYLATFAKSNYVTYNCPECASLELKEVDVKDMVKYPNDKVKAIVEHLLASGEDTTPSILEPKLVQISDDYVFSFRAPTVYGLIFETSALDESFTEKYADILSVLAYIDNIYLIDKESGLLVPIDTNPDPTNVTKTVRRKVIAYYNIIKPLNSDQYGMIGAEVTKIAQNLKDEIKYQIPEYDCASMSKDKTKKCTHHFKPELRTPLQLLFSRHQLVATGNFSIE